MTTTPEQQPELDRTTGTTRRTVLSGAGVIGVAAVLAACSHDQPSSPANGDTNAPTAGSAAPSGTASSGAASSAQAQGGGNVLGPTSDVPVGGGKIYADQKVVVTQPTAGNFKCFTAVCTHMGCTVSSISGGTINCPCHGSQYHITDGSVAGGPAPRPLAEEKINVSGGEITLS